MTDNGLLWLVEATVYDPYLPGTRILRYASHQGFVTGPAETPANTVYDARILQAASMRRDLFDQGTTQGHTRIGFGELILENSDGLLDALLQYGFDGQPITIRLGQPGAAYPGGFSTFLVATMEQCEVSASRVTIRLRDRQQEMDIPLQTQKYGGSNALPDGVDGVATDLKGKPKPVCYGKVLNVPAVCVNTSKLIYQVSDLQISNIDAIYDRGVALGYSLFVASGGSSLPLHSNNGELWKLQPNSVHTAPSSGGIAGCYGAGLWVVVGASGQIATSPDGIVWTQQVSGVGTDLRGVCYGGGLFVAVGLSGVILTSPDAFNWTSRTSGFGGTAIVAVTYGNGIYVVGGDLGTLAISKDGVAWDLQTSGFGANAIKWIAYDSTLNLFVAVGGAGTLTTSSNGTGWTARTSNFPGTSTINNATARNGIFLAVGFDTTGLWVGRSSTGTSWTTVLLDASTGGGLLAMTATATMLLAKASSASGGPFLYLSSDQGATWSNKRVFEILPGVPTTCTWLAAAEGQSSGTYTSTADLLDNSQAPLSGGFKTFPGGGYFRLGSLPTGLITADVTEGATAADRTTAQIFKRVLQRAGKTSADWAAADLTALDVVNSAVLGFWTMQEITVAAVLDKIAASVGAWWGVDRTGVFRIKQFTDPSGTPVASYNANDLEMGLNRQPTGDGDAGIPIYRAVVRHSRVYAVQTSDLAGAVTQARRNLVGLEWREAIATDTDVQRVHLLAPQQVDDSLLTSEADALAEVVRRLALRKVRRDVFELLVEASPANVAVDLGDVVSLTHSRYGLSGGVLFRVIGIEPNPSDRTVRLTAWGSVTSGAVPPAINVIGYQGSPGGVRRGPRFRRPHERKGV